jgi:hypothetical protein
MKKNIKNNKKFILNSKSIFIIVLSLLVILLLILDLGNIFSKHVSKKSIIRPPVTHKLDIPKKKAAVVVPKPNPVTPPAPIKKPSVVAVSPPPPKEVSAPAPVITPAPSSNVNNLTPSSSTPSSSSGSTGSSSSGSSGSGSSSSSPSNPVAYSSTNWSGYLEASGNYTNVSGSWIAPTVTGNGVSTSSDGTWIGIGGVTSSDLIQIGTDNTVSASGIVTTSAFYEELPNPSVNITSLTINPGDKISASVNQTSSNNWTLSITDITTSQSFSTSLIYSSSLSSAEWVQEDPSYSSNSLIPLDKFGTVYFTDCKATRSSQLLNLLNLIPSPVTLVDKGGLVLASPSAIGADSTSFSVVQK